MDPLINIHPPFNIVPVKSFLHLQTKPPPPLYLMTEQVSSERAYQPPQSDIMTSVTDEGEEQHTQRQREEGWRDRRGTGGGEVLSLIKQRLISGWDRVLWPQGNMRVTRELRWSGSQRGSSSCQ